MTLKHVALLLALAGCRDAFAAGDPKKDYPHPGDSAAASASALPVQEPPKLEEGHKPWIPVYAEPFPETASPAPSKEEWLAAHVAKEVRVTDPGCHAKRIREWIRLSCGGTRVEIITGSTADLTLGCPRADKDMTFCDEAIVVFPARRGDRRAFEFFMWTKWGPEPDAIATEQFLPGDEHPMITVQGLRWGF